MKKGLNIVVALALLFLPAVASAQYYSNPYARYDDPLRYQRQNGEEPSVQDYLQTIGGFVNNLFQYQRNIVEEIRPQRNYNVPYYGSPYNRPRSFASPRNYNGR